MMLDNYMLSARTRNKQLARHRAETYDDRPVPPDYLGAAVVVATALKMTWTLPGYSIISCLKPTQILSRYFITSHQVRSSRDGVSETSY
jgi:hypothetical protein